ncbi:MAG TPA: hypothetical protein VGA85_06810 [Dehalococcoidales bacterium]
MSNIDVGTKFHFTPKDFKSCTGKEKDAKYLNSRFKDLFNSVGNEQLFKQEFANFDGYVARTFNQGSKQFRDHMWIGYAHQQFVRPQDEIQFQVGIDKGGFCSIELFADQAGREARQKAKTNIDNNKTTFLKLIKELQDFSIGYSGRDEFRIECEDVTEANIDNILNKIGSTGIHFFIGRYPSENEIIKAHKRIVSQIVFTWIQLRPLYDLLVFNRVDKKPSGLIDTDVDVLKNIVKRFPLRNIDLDETEEEANKRGKKQITYEQNWLAQEKANSRHRKTLLSLARYLKNHGIDTKQSEIDIYAEKNERIFIFEIKSIHKNNFIHQTRAAIGQLLGYEYFSVKSKSENNGKEIIRGITFSDEPTKEIIDFLNEYQFHVFWIKNGKLSGNSESMRLLVEFVSG